MTRTRLRLRAEYDTSSAGEDAVSSAETTRMTRSPATRSEEAAASPSAGDDTLDASPLDADANADASTTQDFSFFGAGPSSSTPSGRAASARGGKAPWDVSLLGDESACFELEQPQLRFCDETESEHETSLLAREVDVEVEPRAATPPAVLKRSLRNRVVTVEVQTPAVAGKPLTRSTRSAARGVLEELQ